MYVTDHARDRLVGRLGRTLAARIMARLESMAGEAGNVAIEVHRISAVRATDTLPDASNGNQVIVIARDGSVETVMLRRSWNQPFTAEALSVHRCVRLGVVA